jgi:hypothetical protein
MNKKMESHYPLLGSCVGAAIAAWLLFSETQSWARPTLLIGSEKLFPSALTVSSIAVGFLTASQSILYSAAHLESIQRLKSREHFSRLIAFAQSAVKYSFGVAVLSGWLLTFNWSAGGPYRCLCLLVWLFCAIGMALRCYRAITIFNGLLDSKAFANSSPKTTDFANEHPD